MFRGVHAYLLGGLLLAFLATSAISIYKNKDINQFYGIAESKEINISFEHNVSIGRILVEVGKRVQKGTLLVELSKTDLELEIALVKNQLDLLAKQNRTNPNPSFLNMLVGKDDDEVDLEEDSDEMKLQFLQNKLNILEQQKVGLFIYAPDEATIGTVNYKAGESVPAFSPIITLVPRAPRIVKGYLHESLGLAPKNGQRVTVYSAAQGEKSVRGKIIAIGERIVPFPDRLKIRSELSQWGREVVIELPKKNPFLVNEKVLIYAKQKKLDLNEEESPLANLHDFNIYVPSAILEKGNVEPSGLYYAKDIEKLIMVSDELPQDKNIEVYGLNFNGRVDEEPLLVSGAKSKIKDLESLSVDENGNITALCSLSYSKGTPIKSRNQLMKISRDKLQMTVINQLNLRGMLDVWARQNASASAARFLNDDLNVEGHFWIGSDLYLGLKEPFNEKEEAVILRVNGVSNLKQGDALLEDAVSVWRTLPLHVEDRIMGISDMILVDGSLYLLSSCLKDMKQGVCGAFWKYTNPEKNGSGLKLIKSFDGIKPEGLTYRESSRDFALVFDAGRKGKPSMMFIPEAMTE